MRRALAGAALTLAAGAAQAADTVPPTLPRLGTCGADTGGFRLPGTEGCLHINGLVAAEGGWAIAPASLSLARRAAPPVRDGADPSRTSLDVGARLSADLRLPTDLGPVRVYVSVRGRNGSATNLSAR